MPDAGEVALLAAIAFSGALIFGITGFGAGLVTIPLATHLVSLQFALALFAVTDLACALRVGTENPRRARREEWVRLVPMIIAGTALGVTLLVNLPRATGMLMLGVFVLSYALYAFFPHAGARVISKHWAWLAGLAGGITSTLFGAGGPPYAIYLSQRGLSKEEFRATMGFATITSISLRVFAFILTGLLLDRAIWLAVLFTVPAALVGIQAARHIFLRISREALLRAIALMLALTGVSLILRAV